ncbi:PhaM family polyhydroxyalkanoate granule multifunctional regulatory protein [Inhella crocodyli]|uniref:Uncharacterized protein n=1 Tax=Inhella crocodyli TaxID=2499851 RepID=A0A3S3T6Z6_9BURK|nr:PhaM family polyhydroxyalkanoate granule multifunctional regulatory protein [Inhella crocodyli]RVT84769.1 hypothetical protein EOD73_11620 [Inhella crocodyli]
MSDAQFSKFVPGFDFLQGLMKNAGSNLPGIGAIGQWVAPTLNPEELGKRIEELRTVQFWLEQNARMLAATIQALEVQRMTLSTLKSMNVPMSELKEALKVPDLSGVPGMPGVPPGAASAVQAGKKVTKKVAGAALKGATKAAGKAAGAAASAAVGASGKGAPGLGVDPMQWWGALTQQFSQVAANAMKDSATDAAKGLAQSLVKQSIDAAGDTLRKAASVPQAVAGSMAKSLSTQRAEAEAAAAPAPKAAPRKRAPAKRR